MKISITTTVDIDADQWASEYDIDRGEVRVDVQNYYGAILGDLASSFNATGRHSL